MTIKSKCNRLTKIWRQNGARYGNDQLHRESLAYTISSVRIVTVRGGLKVRI
jgi:hypothetical protein